MKNLVEPLRKDKSEFVDPIQAADELIVYAGWLRDLAMRESGRRVPLGAAMLLDATADERRGLEVVYSSFKRAKPRRQWLMNMKQKMLEELNLNEEEKALRTKQIQDFETISNVPGSSVPIE